MIHFFSGTGNTRYVAALLSQNLGMSLHEFTSEELRNPLTCTVKDDDSLVIWAFPTYSWGVPPVILRIIEDARFEFRKESVHVCVTTCGDDTGNLDKMFRKKIQQRGFNPGGVFSVQMPNTYVMMAGFDVDSPELVKSKLEACIPRVEEISRQLKKDPRTHDKGLLVRGSFPGVKTSVIYPWFVRHDMNPRYFNVNAENCISCGKCVGVCPMENIRLNESKHPEWGENCAFCTACYHVCPQHAVGWKKTTLRKGQKQIL